MKGDKAVPKTKYFAVSVYFYFNQYSNKTCVQVRGTKIKVQQSHRYQTGQYIHLSPPRTKWGGERGQ